MHNHGQAPTDIFSLGLKPPTLPSTILARERTIPQGSQPVHSLGTFPILIPQYAEAIDVKPIVGVANIDRNMKILIVGNVKCGKTSLIRRYVANTFEMIYKTTVGADFVRKDIVVETSSSKKLGVRLQLWDLAGQDRFQCITRSYYQRASGVIIVCDLSREGTVNSVKSWKNEIDLKLGSIPVILFANKADMLDSPRNAFDAGAAMERICRECNLTAWFGTSAKTGDGVEAGFSTLIRKVLENEGHNSSSCEATASKENSTTVTLQRHEDTLKHLERGSQCC